MNLEKIKINPDDLKWVDCGCPEKNKLFEPSIMFKKMPAFMSSTGKDEVLPVDIVVCKKCGKIPEFMTKMMEFPDDLKNNNSSIDDATLLFD